MKKVFLSILIIFLMVLGGALYFTYLFQEETIFKSHPLNSDHKYTLEHSFEEIDLITLENTHINALWFHKPNQKGVVLFVHGRGKNLNFWSTRAYPFIERGYDVLIFDYRGFGKSAKGFKESWLLEDGEIAYHFLLNCYKEEDIIVYGNSMGTSIATWVASTHHPKMLILEAPFTNMTDAAAHAKPWIPKFLIRWILKYHLRTDKWIKNVDVPTYIFHGLDDKIVPYAHGEILYKKLENGHKNEMITLPKAGHGNIPNDPLYITKLDELLP